MILKVKSQMISVFEMYFMPALQNRKKFLELAFKKLILHFVFPKGNQFSLTNYFSFLRTPRTKFHGVQLGKGERKEPWLIVFVFFSMGVPSMAE